MSGMPGGLSTSVPKNSEGTSVNGHGRSSSSVPNLKILLIGNSSVGKSSMILRYVDKDQSALPEMTATIGVDFKVKFIKVNEKRFKLSIWDTAGQERFRTMTSSYFRGAHGVMLIYDVTSQQSFSDLDKWITELDKRVSATDQIRFLIGNKIENSDERVISFEAAQQYAAKVGMDYFECSANMDEGVDDAFEQLCTKIISNPTLWRKPSVQAPTEDLSSPGSSTISFCPC